MANLSPERSEQIQRELDRYVWLLDDCIRIPGTRIRTGVDGLAGLIPGIGDIATAVVALGLVARYWQLGAPKRLVARMLLNVGIDALVGLIPVLGDAFDVVWKANRRNIDLMRRHSLPPPEPAEARRRPKPGAVWLFGLLVVALTATLVVGIRVFSS
ncbi:DUF4112 domain-containing protein [uncultured Abyssibacter sp.]|uniref:DUF4112 domain-containing protein n=1 Tax=uncultured Abyssibacter sp. TaxID=2320202 RepID=UPI0032B23DDF|tara:strand:- start:74 stop:544 length:471 start_codon:yes stop_codon:yes gene_type:complete